MYKRQVLSLVGAALLAMPVALSAHAETVASEAREHPRIAKAINELEDAIKYLQAAPHDFGGHKAKAIADSQAAVTQLRLALRYRAIKDNKK